MGSFLYQKLHNHDELILLSVSGGELPLSAGAGRVGLLAADPGDSERHGGQAALPRVRVHQPLLQHHSLLLPHAHCLVRR